ncbi:cytochrome P450 [Actinokineospora fastidiosa]|uniref:Cytochrome P450 n=1 Tax=Actinokineospora fastidiosa TaxID=1816 RepID=A0A918LH93_9PSEU|nr:cytochrome P450 [Actinokineospora fastidiosa]GGS47344.1 cytochrome P450 [Actinokineospora fastidiosa]
MFPLVASGLVVRRPRTVGLLTKAGAYQAMLNELRRMRVRYGPGPASVRLGKRRFVIPLSAEDAALVLAETPVPFSPANREKVAALRHFQPHGLLISPAAARRDRRRFTEHVLDTPLPMHRLSAPFAAAVSAEAEAMLEHDRLDWPTFADGWWRLVRRITLGKGARDDVELIDLLHTLRADGNWSYLHPRRQRRRQRFAERLESHLDRAEPGSLAGLTAAQGSQAVDQFPQWLFAFDAAGMAVMRTLTLVTSHPEILARLRDETDQRPVLRACVLESLRLWPTTPAILRDTTEATDWGPPGTTVAVITPLFHRDSGDRFDPDLWLDGRAALNPALLPFSTGPAGCPGRNLVLFITSTLIHALLSRADLTPKKPLTGPMPANLNPFKLTLTKTK